MYDFKKVEAEINLLWRRIGLLSKLQKKNRQGKNYFLLDGPPYANFIPHVGHIRNTVYKDVNIRLALMRGHKVLFQPGFDTHGLPVENMVEKKLNLHSKKDIEKLGIKKFTANCKKWAATNKDLWLDVYAKLGSWYSWKEPYLTYQNSYIESGWWTFKQLWDKGMVYEGQKPVYWCPACQTALAGYEVTDSYKMLSDPAIFLKFKVANKDESLLVYTTTPWTLLSNVAIVAHPDEDYVKVETIKGALILAKKRLVQLTELGLGYKVIEEFKGKELEGLKYEPIIDVPVQKELNKNPNAHKVYMSIPILKERIASKVAAKKDVGESVDVFGHFVNVEEGTGLVHTAPGHGKTDNEVGAYYGLPEASPLDDECKFTAMAGQFGEVFVKDADKAILDVLEKTGRLLYCTKIEHKYPVCWRCKSPLIFRMSNQWFLKVDVIKKDMLKLNRRVKWLPEFARERFSNWVANADDWNISRQRYWGIPMPTWKCDCGKIKVIGSLNELKENSLNKITEDFDLHTVNDVFFKCSCGKKMSRIRDIFDVWYDSGIAPWASLGYPFKNKKLFQENFPVDRINESQDQIRGWFYSLMFCSVATFENIPYKTVSMPGWVVDENGEKMSKSLGNVIPAKEAIEELGADSLRFYYMWDVAPYALQKFNKKVVKKEAWRVLNILWNIHNYQLSQKVKTKKTHIKEIEDKWILSRLNSLIESYSTDLENFEYHSAGRAIADFIVEDVSRGYIQLIRNRVDDPTAHYILEEILTKIITLLAPITPFITEKIHQNLKSKKESVHLLDWPVCNKKLVDKDLERDMKSARLVIQHILSEREKLQLGVRWPLGQAHITIKDETIRRSLNSLKHLIERQANIKELSLEEKKPRGVKEMQHSKISYGSVCINKKITKDLEREGFAREIMRRIQELRKKLGFNKENKIKLSITSSYDISDWKEEIQKKVGARDLIFKEAHYKYRSKEKIKEEEFIISFQKF